MRSQILIIEDNEMSFVLAEYLLRQAGYSIIRASDGDSAVHMALQNNADLILCDLDLPARDGYQVVNALRTEATWKPVPLIAFTAASTGNAQNHVLASGFEGYISKPIDPRTFTATIARFLPPSPHAS